MEVKSALAPNGKGVGCPGVGNPRLKMSLGESVWAPGRSREKIQAFRKKDSAMRRVRDLERILRGRAPESLGRRL